MQDDNLLVGIDIGTTEVRCLIGKTADAKSENRFQALGFGRSSNRGMKAGAIAVCDDVAQAVAKALKQVKINSDYNVGSATININGKDIKASSVKAQVEVTSSKKIISTLETDAVEERARQNINIDKRKLTQFFINDYIIDNLEHVIDPLGLEADTLSIQALAVTISNLQLENIFKVTDALQLDINDLAVSSMAIAHATYNHQDWENGVVFIDIGYATTNVAVIKDNKIELIEVFKFGSFLVTQDIALVLRIDLDTAEFLKTKYASFHHASTGTKTVTFNSKVINFSPKILSSIVTSRWQEICKIIAKTLKKNDHSQLLGGVVLAGGGSFTKGLKEMLEKYLDTHIRYGQIKDISGLNDFIDDHRQYLTVAGLMIIDSGIEAQLSESSIESEKSNTLFAKFINWFK